MRADQLAREGVKGAYNKSGLWAGIEYSFMRQIEIPPPKKRRGLVTQTSQDPTVTQGGDGEGPEDPHATPDDYIQHIRMQT